MTDKPAIVHKAEVLPLLSDDDLTTLDRLSKEIHDLERKTRGAMAAEMAGTFAMGRRLLQARTIHRDNKSYGRWFGQQNFGFKLRWANVLCLAAENQDAVQELMVGGSGLDSAVKAVMRSKRGALRSALPNDHRLVLPATIKVECRDARDHFPGELADLAIFSPPYPDAGKVYDNQDGAIGMDEWRDLITTAAAVMSEGWQVARACMVIPAAVGRSPYVPLTGIAWDALAAGGFQPEGEIVWDKATTGNRTTWGSNRLPTEPRLRDRHEVVLIGRSTHAQRIPEDTFVDDGTGRRVSPWLDQLTFLDLTQSVWALGPESAQRVGHPAPFPPKLAERLLRLYGWPGCTVLDPFAGSGSVGEAAITLGANAVLCDQSEDYCERMRARLGMQVAS